jgi:acylglycerol lipase
MNHRTEVINTADGLQLFTQSWAPENTPRAHLLFVHGFAEHSSRYKHVAEFFTGKGFALHTYDLRGHGRSGGKTAYVDRFDLYLKDLTTVLDHLKVGVRDQPIFLIGQSMGAAIVTLFVITRQPKGIAGVLLSGAALKISSEVSPWLKNLQQLSGVIGAWLPKVKTVKLDSKAISRDPKVVEDYENDPLVYHDGTYARTGAELVRASKQIYANMEKFKLPVLIMHGTADRITDPEGSKELERRAGSPDKKLELYNELYHDLLHEPEQKQVMGDMLAWIEERV